MTIQGFIHWRSIIWLLIAGPPFGMLALLVGMSVSDPSEIKGMSDLGKLLALGLLGLPFAYLLGAVPAVIAGLAFGCVVVITSPSLLQRRSLCVAVGGAVGGLSAFVFSLIVTKSFDSGSLFWLSIGAFAGASSALVVRCRQIHANRRIAS